jgi:NADPH:quinone reductase-like Zn-dependent oxidoreductase
LRVDLASFLETNAWVRTSGYASAAELCVVKTELLAKVRAGLDLVEAAALPLVSATGCQLISVAGEARVGQTVLVSAANGAVGRCAVFTAKDRACFVIACVRAKDVEAASRLGAHRVVALDDPVAVRAVEPVDLVTNCLHGLTPTSLLAKVKSGGLFASVTGA